MNSCKFSYYCQLHEALQSARSAEVYLYSVLYQALAMNSIEKEPQGGLATLIQAEVRKEVQHM